MIENISHKRLRHEKKIFFHKCTSLDEAIAIQFMFALKSQ